MTPVAGTSRATVGCTTSTSPAASLCLAVRVSAMRVGTTLAARLSPAPYQADTSTTTFAGAEVNTQMSPLAPRATVARFGTVAPAV